MVAFGVGLNRQNSLMSVLSWDVAPLDLKATLVCVLSCLQPLTFYRKRHFVLPRLAIGNGDSDEDYDGEYQ